MKTIVANWKMNVGLRGAVALARGTLLSVRGKKVLPEIVLCPPFVALSDVHKVVARSRAVLGAQDVCFKEEGSYTGEISVRMLSEVGVTHVIVGHSERRSHMQEDDATIAKKIKTVLEASMTPILCVGEKEPDDVEQAHTELQAQLRGALEGLVLPGRGRLLVAYEPVWAIGTGVSATPAHVIDRHRFIREVLADIDRSFANCPVLYGGSVTKENAYAFLREDQIDGVLVGGASVKLGEFIEIIQAAVDIMEGSLEAGKNV